MEAESDYPKLPKLPFIVLDVCLVVTAIIIKIGAGSTPTLTQHVLMVACVLLGGLLCCLPFFVEFRTHAQLMSVEIAEDSDRNARRIEVAHREIATAMASIQQHAAVPEKAAKAFASLIKRFESRIDALEAEDRNFDALANDLQEGITSLMEREREETLRRTQELLESVSLNGLSEQLSAIEHAIANLERQPVETQPAIEPSPSVTLDDVSESEPDAPVLEPEDAFDERSLEQPPTNDTPSVVDTDTETPETPHPDDIKSDDAETESAIAEAVPDADASGDFESATDVVLNEDADAPVSAIMSDDDWGDGWGEAATGEPEVDEDLSSQQAELIDDVDGPAPKTKRAGKSQTTVVAQVLIGIGNKPYVRGTGGGLSPDKGVPMEFLEIGKWQWIAPQDAEQVSVHIYKNDDVPDEGGPVTLKPGQRISVTPRFSA